MPGGPRLAQQDSKSTATSDFQLRSILCRHEQSVVVQVRRAAVVQEEWLFKKSGKEIATQQEEAEQFILETGKIHNTCCSEANEG